ncbi:putative cell surface spherulin 4-like protein [Dactylonectria estremocensis]|uniref:Cell surface spherulin 4-like protein n=1 Tax=Dactylonectria estremocensis TaxID=1079267 RepID=A0A9P9F6V3_9HYPO|nr:putative cell surface spherulin 4-like protein [Dactylonectria estremocensis]
MFTMRPFISFSALGSLIASVSATGILLPLYIYPAADWDDNAANWKPVIEAVEAHAQVDWTIVVNPNNGPGLSGKPADDDVNFVSGVSQLNAHANVNTVGYVRTNYAKAPMDELKANITNYANWASYPEADISIHGIFFDESEADFDYLNEAITYAREAFGKSITTVCNFGVKAAEEYYGICDIVIAFESCLDCEGLPQYQGQETFETNVPSGHEPQAAIIVNKFTGEDFEGKGADASLLTSYARALVDGGIGWYYFCSADYDDITSTPATVHQNALSLAGV